jgi:Zn-finger nucleic acid-binding protein
MSHSSAATLKCPNCGAPAAPGATKCDYCRAQLATVSCPSCFGALFDGAAFCQHCGTARSRKISDQEIRIACPACRERMTWVEVGSANLLECAACEGVWIEATTFERLCIDRESQSAVVHTAHRAGAASSPRRQPVQYRPCPRCQKLMNRVNFGKVSGAVVDVCKGHGTFLDRGELHQIVQFIQGGGMDRSRAAEKEHLVEEQRRLRDLEGMRSRLGPDRQGQHLWAKAGYSATSGMESVIADLLSALF